ncbi:hypothetical protein BDY19DRAFT_630961 [Irpex rosettiformis]|uniref:Uncharacterized protein n=1 Tax=Irpex rosettiformis TaxID=378272 RepID=A0ACB8UB97_9APHY|nr:hypothetical protein BDY19DRAFT_630961 [Irpex rosettiformis]
MIRDTCLVAPQHVDDETVLLHMMKDGKFETEVYALVTVLTRDDIPITKLCHVATFGYPQVKSDLITPANGFITGSSGGGLMPNFSVPERPFVRSAVNPLIFLIRYYHDIRHHVTRVTHVFPLSFIQSLVAAFRNTGMHQEVPWSQWGPQSSRCFVDHTTVITGAYGSQILLSDWRMLEFSPQVVSRELMRAGKSSLSRSRRRLRLGRPLRDVELPEGGRIVRRPTVFRKGQVFDQDVVTCMPYRETQLSRVSANPALVFGGEVWVACTTEVSYLTYSSRRCMC